jgi:Fic family protein
MRRFYDYPLISRDFRFGLTAIYPNAFDVFMYKWKPIENLTPEQLKGHPAVAQLFLIWREQAERLKESESVRQFQEKLNREWAVETGIIENLYSLDRGTTRTLIEHGIQASFIAHDGADKPPEWVAAVLRDQQNALEFVFDFVGTNRSLSISYIKELHSLLTRHQETAQGVDSMGRTVSVEIVHGDWKRLPNNPTRKDGTIHEYCPPEHVVSEMERLIAWHGEHSAQKAPPEVEAAWLHHRFTQIHPFQDGNGRMARCLASLVFIKAGGFPLVVDRDHRNAYIDALEQADAGSLSALVKIFADIERRWFLKAISISESLLSGRAVTRRKILEAASRKLAGRQKAAASERNKVFDLAVDAQKHLETRLFELKSEIDEILGTVPDLSCRIQVSSPEQKNWFRHQIVELARHLEYFADLQTLGEWSRLQIRNGEQTDIVFSIHSVGTEFLGVAGVSAFLQVKTPSEESSSAAHAPVPLCRGLFQITYLDTWETLAPQFDEWLDEVLAVALDQWQKGL